MVSIKDRRNSGRYTPKATCSPKELSENDLFIQTEYDDWRDHRDSFRDWYRDRKMIKDVKIKYHNYITESDIKREAANKKQIMLIKRRKARK